MQWGVWGCLCCWGCLHTLPGRRRSQAVCATFAGGKGFGAGGQGVAGLYSASGKEQRLRGFCVALNFTEYFSAAFPFVPSWLILSHFDETM